jgi:hypothetical protein
MLCCSIENHSCLSVRRHILLVGRKERRPKSGWRVKRVSGIITNYSSCLERSVLANSHALHKGDSVV